MGGRSFDYDHCCHLQCVRGINLRAKQLQSTSQVWLLWVRNLHFPWPFVFSSWRNHGYHRAQIQSPILLRVRKSNYNCNEHSFSVDAAKRSEYPFVQVEHQISDPLSFELLSCFHYFGIDECRCSCHCVGCHSAFWDKKIKQQGNSGADESVQTESEHTYYFKQQWWWSSVLWTRCHQ